MTIKVEPNAGVYAAEVDKIKKNQEVKKTEELKKKEDAEGNVKNDYYEKKEEKPAKVEYTIDEKKINQLKMDFEQRQAAFIKMVRDAIKGQVDGIEDVIFRLKELKEKGETVDPELVKQAEAEIGPDGYYGVEKTADRLIEFAKAISGGDPSKIETLKEAVKKGFEMAKEVLGELPEISQKTYDRVMEKFDEWEKEGQSAQ